MLPCGLIKIMSSNVFNMGGLIRNNQNDTFIRLSEPGRFFRILFEKKKVTKILLLAVVHCD